MVRSRGSRGMAGLSCDAGEAEDADAGDEGGRIMKSGAAFERLSSVRRRAVKRVEVGKCMVVDLLVLAGW